MWSAPNTLDWPVMAPVCDARCLATGAAHVSNATVPSPPRASNVKRPAAAAPASACGPPRGAASRCGCGCGRGCGCNARRRRRRHKTALPCNALPCSAPTRAATVTQKRESAWTAAASTGWSTGRASTGALTAAAPRRHSSPRALPRRQPAHLTFLAPFSAAPTTASAALMTQTRASRAPTASECKEEGGAAGFRARTGEQHWWGRCRRQRQHRHALAATQPAALPLPLPHPCLAPAALPMPQRPCKERHVRGLSRRSRQRDRVRRVWRRHCVLHWILAQGRRLHKVSRRLQRLFGRINVQLV